MTYSGRCLVLLFAFFPSYCVYVQTYPRSYICMYSAHLPRLCVRNFHRRETNIHLFTLTSIRVISIYVHKQQKVLQSYPHHIPQTLYMPYLVSIPCLHQLCQRVLPAHISREHDIGHADMSAGWLVASPEGNARGGLADDEGALDVEAFGCGVGGCDAALFSPDTS